jgi:hypothetical protein
MSIKHAVHTLKSDNEMSKKAAKNKHTSNAFQAFCSNRLATFHAQAPKLRKSYQSPSTKRLDIKLHQKPA